MWRATGSQHVRLVVDTNVLVSAMLHPGRTPDLALAAAIARGARVLCDDRIEREYRDVVSRAKFARVPADRRDALLRRVLDASDRVVAGGLALAMIDADDLAFVEVAVAAAADAIVTGNVRHFPPGLGVAVWTPAELLARLGVSG